MSVLRLDIVSVIIWNFLNGLNMSMFDRGTLCSTLRCVVGRGSFV